MKDLSKLLEGIPDPFNNVMDKPILQHYLNFFEKYPDEKLIAWLLTLTEEEFDSLKSLINRGLSSKGKASVEDAKSEGFAIMLAYANDNKLPTLMTLLDMTIDNTNVLDNAYCFAKEIKIVESYKKGYIDFGKDEDGNRVFETIIIKNRLEFYKLV